MKTIKLRYKITLRSGIFTYCSTGLELDRYVLDSFFMGDAVTEIKVEKVFTKDLSYAINKARGTIVHKFGG